jgi:hypothetical protein
MIYSGLITVCCMAKMSYYMTMQVIQTCNYYCTSRGQTTQPMWFRQTHITIFYMLVTAPLFWSNLLHLSTRQYCTSIRPHGVTFAVRSPRLSVSCNKMASSCSPLCGLRHIGSERSQNPASNETATRSIKVATHRPSRWRGSGNGLTSEIMGDQLS